MIPDTVCKEFRTRLCYVDAVGRQDSSCVVEDANMDAVFRRRMNEIDIAVEGYDRSILIIGFSDVIKNPNGILGTSLSCHPGEWIQIVAKVFWTDKNDIVDLGLACV